ncbi:MAG: histidine phosphatase family protein [Rhodobacteraceae bacterium]|nr:histidine phosphatase family protein [Paracoccaceae bacterium]
MGEVYFVRHAQASHGAVNYDLLSPLGHQQADWLGAHLALTVGGFDKVVSGSLKRHRQTLAAIKNNLGLPDSLEDQRLNEMSFFQLERAYQAAEGLSPPNTQPEMEAHFASVMAAWAEDRISGAPECFADFRARILAAIGEHAVNGAKVLLVSSGGPAGVLMQHVLGLDQAGLTNVILRTYNASYSRFLVRPDGLHLLQFNAIAHLEHPDRQHAQTYL